MLLLMGLVDVVQSREITIIAKKYHSHSVTKRRAHWSLKNWCGMLPSNITRKQKNTSGRLSSSLFFKAQTSELWLTMLWLSLRTVSMEVYKTEEEQRLVEDEERAEEKEKTAEEAGRRKSGHRKERPMKKRVDEL